MAGPTLRTYARNAPEPIGFWKVRLDREFTNDGSTTENLRNDNKNGMGLLFSSHVTFTNGNFNPELLSDDQFFQIALDAFKEMEEGWNFWKFDEFLTRRQKAQNETQKNKVMTVLAVDRELYLSSSAKGPRFKSIERSQKVSKLLEDFQSHDHTQKSNVTHMFEGKCGEILVLYQFNIRHGLDESMLKNSRVVSVERIFKGSDEGIVMKVPCGVSHLNLTTYNLRKLRLKAPRMITP
jgi:hypothetical protein